VELVYVIEVPRILALEAKMPEAEDFAQAVLEAGQNAAAAARARVEPLVQRARNPQDAILSLIGQRGIDLLVLATRADEMRGLPHDMVRELFQRAPCEVVVDYVPA
jgi:nucleotide-binding universal stress UspA family protein